jgi:hypothetical protein
MERLALHMTLSRFESHDFVCHQGDKSDKIFLVCAGRVRVVRAWATCMFSRDRAVIDVALLSDRGFYGGADLTDDTRTCADSLVCVGRCVVYALPKAELLRRVRPELLADMRAASASQEKVFEF